jgi:type IV pilus assembly protein PilY1
MFYRNLKPVLTALAAVGTVLSLHAQIAQDPLLSRTAAVEPNIVFMFDDSGSMPARVIYQYGGTAGGLGMTGPADDTFSTMFAPPAQFHDRSPDVNLIYYDPRVTYSLRINPDNTFQAPGNAAAVSSFDVYFYKPATTTLYSVNNVTISAKGSGYPASGVTASFAAPPAGGVQARASVTTSASTMVSAVNVANGGSGYSTSGVTAAFSAPAAGGVTATANVTVQAVPTGAINTSVSVNSSGNGYASVPTVVFAAPPAGGTRATGTAVMSGNGRKVVSITVTNAGAGYTSTPTIGFAGGSGSGAQATATLATVNKVTAINLANGGSGYTSTPTLTLGNTGGGSGATFSISTGATNVISAITITNAGSGYTTQPALTLSGTGSGSGLVRTVNYTGTVVTSVNKTWDGAGTPTTAASYFTPGYTPDAGSPLATGASVIAYPNTASSSTANYPKFRNRTDCGATTCTWAQEQQNYANFLKYHSTRLELAKTGIGLAFQPLNPTFRLGWATINNLDDSNRLEKGVRLYDKTVQGEFLTWLYGLSAPGNTPNRIALDRVGQYYQRADNNGPWAKSPNGSNSLTGSGTDSSHASCRRSYAMLMTDGYYNDSFTIADSDTTLGPRITAPSTYQYTPIGPYSDTASGTKYSNSFADVAMKYWLTDLRPDLSNNVRSIASDEAYWQHLNFYAIGLGVIGTLDANDPAVLKGLTGSASSTPPRTLDWPTPASNSPRSIDDMWHATVNGRGKLLNAKTAAELNASILTLMSDINGKEGTQSGVAVSTASLTKDTKKYTPSYTPVSWAGNVTAFSLDATSGNQTGIAWQVEKLVSTDPQTGAKTYASIIPSAASRNIFVGNGNTSGTRAVPFTYASLSSAGLTASMNGTVNSALIDYLRGDPTNEANSGSTFGLYRGRDTRLGDIVNSTPVFVKDTLDQSYDTLPTTVAGQSTYQTFVSDKKRRGEGVLFVGANDGMLHAFRDGTYDPTTGAVIQPGGIEVFAYVPKALLPTLNLLAEKTYPSNHRFYVDGPNTETDAYVATPSNATPHWSNIVLGSTGAGAGAPSSSGVSPRSAVFALDVTSLNTSSTGMDANSVLWEISSSNSSFAEMGYVLTDVQSGPTLDGSWVAIFGNGYESKSCQARLYVVNVQSGALIREINTNSGNCTTSKNGLGGVRIVRNSKQQIIGVYAGDLLGNLWKFSLNDSNAGNWKVDLSGAPLYTAGITQPITAAPAVVTLSAATAPSTGYMVVAGTGKFFEASDLTTVTQQSIYGLWDPLAFGAATIPAGTTLSSNALLVQQIISAPVTGANGNRYASISTNAVSYTGATPRRGWYINLPNTGQRLVYPLDLLVGRVGVADTISPANISLDPCTNTTSGTGYLYLFDALTGAGPSVAVLDSNGDGVVNTSDLLVSGLEGSADGRNVTLKVKETQAETTFVNVSGSAPGGTLITISCTITNSCATPGTSKLKSREWRQLFMR